MHRRRLTGALAFGLVMASAGARVSFAQDDPLRAHQWVHRLLLVFTPSRESQASVELAAALEWSDIELSDRDMLVGWFSAAEGNQLGDAPISAEAVAHWRSRLAIEREDFVAVLVGKDGGIKARYDEPPRLADVFALIDGMPMRRAELRRRRAPQPESP